MAKPSTSDSISMYTVVVDESFDTLFDVMWSEVPISDNLLTLAARLREKMSLEGDSMVKAMWRWSRAIDVDGGAGPDRRSYAF